MKIGFDAKRAFLNFTGLGNYSRSIIKILSRYYHNHQYILYTPLIKNSVLFTDSPNVKIALPEKPLQKMFKSYWRSFALTNQIKKDKIDIYHGLSNELPFHLNKIKIKSIVTIHDLVFIRYPYFYKFIDRKIYAKKFRYSCQIADKIIATSKQTKEDLINYFNIDENKIEVIYQCCDSLFYKKIDNSTKLKIQKKYKLPLQYILSVGTIEERKNLLNVVKALNTGKIDMPLVAVGSPTKYINKVKKYIAENRMENHVLFKHNVPLEDLPVLYQMAEVFIYPSFFEGFGIPILEALNSGTPVITSKQGCFPEIGGTSSLYISPDNIDEIAEALQQVLTDSSLRNKMIANGYKYAQNFTEEKIARKIYSSWSLG